MSMYSRILPREEWGRLDSIGLPLIGPTVAPDDAKIVVVEEDGEIVSMMAVIRVAHYENLWIAPKYRGNAGLVSRLMKTAKESVLSWGSKWVWGASDTPHMTDLITRLGGVKMPIDSFMIPLGGDVKCLF